MKRWGSIIGPGVVAAWLIVQTISEFFANETIEYYTSEPLRLLYVTAIGVAGGLALFGLSAAFTWRKRQVAGRAVQRRTGDESSF